MIKSLSKIKLRKYECNFTIEIKKNNLSHRKEIIVELLDPKRIEDYITCLFDFKMSKEVEILVVPRSMISLSSIKKINGILVEVSSPVPTVSLLCNKENKPWYILDLYERLRNYG